MVGREAGGGKKREERGERCYPADNVFRVGQVGFARLAAVDFAAVEIGVVGQPHDVSLPGPRGERRARGEEGEVTDANRGLTGRGGILEEQVGIPVWRLARVSKNGGVGGFELKKG